MRLLRFGDDEELSLTEYVGESIPPYAILSHTWGADHDEVSFKDISERAGTAKRGYRKLMFCGMQAKSDNISFFWVDTCCIDKSSSAELSEAINSMFRWYQDAAKCYVYLSDVSTGNTIDASPFSQIAWQTAFRNCAWFTRGWTLQELIAPPIVEFFSENGKLLGNKTSLVEEINKISGIPTEALLGGSLSAYSVDERLSWMENRRTKREEDAAYSLLGIFDIYMPLIYGEGRRRAFIRLRREIREQTNDNTTEAPTEHATTLPTEPRSTSHRYLPFHKNRRFVGRTSVFKTLDQKLFSHDDQAAPRVAIVGLGGVGKTQVALQIAYWTLQHRPDWHVFWVPALSLASFEQACKAIVQMVGLGGADNEDPKQLLQHYLESDASGRWLLIVDNADDEEVMSGGIQGQEQGIAEFLPRSERGRILFTTRAQRVAIRLVQGETVHLSQMDADEARALLIKSLGGEDALLKDETCVAELLEILTYLPLAIVQAAAYLNETGASVAEYIRLLRNTERDMVELLETEFTDDTRYNGGQNAVASTWVVSFEQIRKNPDAAMLLSFIAHVEFKAIPRSMLPSVGSEQRMTRAIGVLRGYSFLSIREDDATYDMHRLVHLASRLWADRQGTSREQKQEVLVHLSRIFDTDEWEERERWRQFLPHVLKAIKINGEAENWGDEECGIAYWAAMCLQLEGQYRDTIGLLEQVVAVQERISAETDPYRLTVQHSLAIAYQIGGQVKTAIRLQEKVVEIYKRTVAETDPALPMAQYVLAVAYRADGRNKEAIGLLEQVVEIHKSTLAETHPSRLGPQHELAIAYHTEGRVKETIELIEHVVEVRNRTLAETHPDRLASQHELARAYFADGRIKEPIRLLEQVVQIRKRTLAETHRDSLTSQHELAREYCVDGRFKEAIGLLVHVIAIQGRTLGETDPIRLMSQHTLAVTYYVDSQVKRAVELLRYVVAIKQRTMSVDDPARVLSEGWLDTMLSDYA